MRSTDSRRGVRTRSGRAAAAIGAVLALSAGCGDFEAPGSRIPENPTFSSDVAAIVHANCTSCHRTGGIAPFALTEYEQVASRAALVAESTRSRRMPPWLPEPGDHPLLDELSLTEAEIRILERWAANGAPLGDAAAVPIAPRPTSGWALGEPDLVLEMTEPFLVVDAGHEGGQHGDLFRNFVLAVPTSEMSHVRAIELRGEGIGVVHHATMGVDGTAASRHEDARDPEPGFEGLHTSSRVRQPSGFVLGWTPGSIPRPNPEGLTWPLEPGVDFVVQTHLMPADTAIALRLQVGLYLEDSPAEHASLVENLFLLGRTIDIPAGREEYIVEDAFVLPVDAEILGLYPHAHYLARTLEVVAELPGGENDTVLEIGDWDFNWQQVYRFDGPVSLPAGTRLRMRWVFDNSGSNPNNPNDPPERVTYGLRSSDEMAEVWLQARPRVASELTAFQRAVDGKRTRDYLELFEHVVRIRPADPLGHTELGAVLASAGRVDEAIRHYEVALGLEPDLPDGHFELAILRASKGEAEGAVRHLEETIRLHPDHAAAHLELGSIHLRMRQTAPAREHGRRAIEIDPRSAEGHVLLGNIAAAEGDGIQAIDHYRRAVQVAPRRAGVRFDLANSLIRAGRAGEAIEHIRAGAELAPQNISPILAAGWVLASHPDEGIRSPEHALEVGTLLGGALGQNHPMALDLQAAAHAAAGRFGPAISMSRSALAGAGTSAQPALSMWIRRRIELYSRQEPYLNNAGPYPATLAR